MTIDRYALVARHNPRNQRIDPYAPLSVGNGSFAFTGDVTGLQTFPDAYTGGIPLCTMAEWGWHESPYSPSKRRLELAEIEYQPYDTGGRQVRYPTRKDGQEEAYHWLRMNPHKFHLGRIGLRIELQSGEPANPSDIAGVDQSLDLWRGMLHSRFAVEGAEVETWTCCHPERDILAFSIRTPLIKAGRIKIAISFPYPSPDITGADWHAPGRHTTAVMEASSDTVELLRVADDTRYFVRIASAARVRIARTAQHEFLIEPLGDGEAVSFVVSFAPLQHREPLPSFENVASASERHWEAFWSEGGAVELAGSTDPRAEELERRVVLSQYLTAIQCSGSMPPQETGLTCNSWYGKFHLEMHWWHAAHFALWGRARLLERSMWWYHSILERARRVAQEQGYKGARWPKMVAYDGRESPSPIGPLLIWQQPHPIYYAELIYRSRPTQQTLDMYKELVFESATFMASYAARGERSGRYHLGPPLIPAQENHPPHTTVDPVFELEYWRFGLEVANEWRTRLGMAAEPKWAEVARGLGPLPVHDGVYMAHARCPDTFTKFNRDHPSMLGALGILPGRLVDLDVMGRTLDRVRTLWRYEAMWGWDFPMIAMTAARLGLPELAVDALMCDSPKNTYLPNGHNRQVTRNDLPLYLPGNGGLLMAVGMMTAGWDGAPTDEAPGFPKDGSWSVRSEGLSQMP